MRRQALTPTWQCAALCLLLALLLAACSSPKQQNTTPVAKAGDKLTANIGQVVELDGTNSLDPDGDPLSFAWTFTLRPEGSKISLTGANIARASFIPDLPGDYELKLTVSDGQATDSDLLRITVIAVNSPPVADVGADRTVSIGDTLQLDGADSSDPEGDKLSFAWSFVSKPPSSGASLQNSETPRPSFVPDVIGAYELELTVNDGNNIDSDSIIITAQVNSDAGPNQSPKAEAGSNRVIAVGESVELDGTGSTDLDKKDLLSFSWRFVSKPAGSSAALDDSSSRTPSFTADVAGVYELELTVSDGQANDTDTVSIRVNRPPQADAGADQQIKRGNQVNLAGSGSTDPDGDTLSFSWTFVSKPSSSTAALQNPNSQNASFTPDKEGNYLLELTVSDGFASARDRVTIEVIPTSGTVSSVLYVSPSGDDGNPGTESEPLKTLKEALDRAHANPEISRISLAAGTYDDEPFGYVVGKDLQIVGPEDPDKIALLKASSDLLLVGLDAFVTIAHLRLESGSTAVQVGDDAAVSLVDVTCEASSCVLASFGTIFAIFPGGNVTITGSSLFSTGTGNTAGVTSVGADNLTIVDSTITGFDIGVASSGTPFVMRDSTLSSNGTGLSVSGGSSTLVRGSTFSENDIGISTSDAKNVSVKGTDILGSLTAGVKVDFGGGVVLEDVIIKNGNGDGLIIGKFLSQGEVVTVRDSIITENEGHGVAVHGEESVLDLGNAGEEANNQIFANDGFELFDTRPSDAGGLITLHGTELNDTGLPPGTYSGPTVIIPNGIKIVNDTEIIAF